MRGLAWTLVALPVLLGCEAGGPAESPPEGGFRVLTQPKKAPEHPAPDPAIWEEAQEDPGLEAGRVVWVGTCIRCHSTGLGGAPLIGNRTLWQPRIDQGIDVLVEHATEGFYGKKGEMPARGGNAELSDDQVRAAVEFMASRAM